MSTGKDSSGFILKMAEVRLTCAQKSEFGQDQQPPIDLCQIRSTRPLVVHGDIEEFDKQRRDVVGASPCPAFHGKTRLGPLWAV